MATTIYFNGRVTAIPGSYSEVDASGLAKIGLGATGIVACIGEAEGGQPTVVTNITNPGKVSRTFRDGDLLEAGLILFDPSKDTQIPGGAQEVKFYKVNPSTQSALTVDDSAGADSITFTSADYGLFTTKIGLDISDGTTAGKAVTIEFNGDTETFDNVGATAPLLLKYSGDTDVAVTAGLDRVTGLTTDATATLTMLNDYVGSFAVPGDDTAFTQPGSAGTVALVSTAAGDTMVATVYGLDAASAPLSEAVTLTGTVSAAGTSSFAKIHGIHFASAPAGTVSLTRGGAVWSGTATDGLVVPDTNIELALNGTLSIVAGAASVELLTIYGKNSAGANASETVTLNGTTPVATATSWSEISLLAVGDVAAATTVTVSGDIWQQGEQVTIVSDNAGDTQTATVYGLSAAGAVQSEDVVLSGVTPVQTTATYNSVWGVALSAAATGTITVKGSPAAGNPTITAFTFAATNTAKGVRLLTTAMVAGGTTVNWTTNPGGYALLIGVNAAGAAAMEKINLTSTGTSSTSWTTITGVARGFDAAAITLTADMFTLSVATYPHLDDVTTYLATQAGFSYTLNATAPKTFDLDDFDEFTAQSVPSGGYSMLAVQQAIVSEINAGSAFVTAAQAASSTAPPANTATTTFLIGGIEGVTTFSHWQAALDTLRDYRINTIVILTSDEAVHAAVVSHCNWMAGPGRSERDCLLGSATVETLAQLKARAIALGTRHARLFGQDIVRFNTAGAREQFPPYFTACVAAGMQAGSSVGTSLTFKYANVLDVKGDDATYTVKDDANELIQGGLCVLEKVPNVGYRFLRNNTTHLLDDNLAYCEASVNEAVNFAVYGLRTALETIVGQAGFSGTVNAALGVSVGLLGELIAAGAITSYQNLTIELVDDVMTVDVEIAPIIPVNFIKTTLHLVSASFSAA